MTREALLCNSRHRHLHRLEHLSGKRNDVLIVFELQFVVSYGKMPFPVTYSVKATYVSPETGIASLTSPLNGGSQGYNLSGMHMNTNTLPLREGQGVGLRGIYIINGKKMLMR